MSLELYYPLKEGRRALYRYSDAERGGEGLTAERVSRNVRTEGGAVLARWEEAFTGGRPFRRSFQARLGPEELIEDEVRLLTAPLQAGRSWDDGPDTFRIVSLDEQARVPAGDFTGCLRVDFGNDDLGWGTLLFAKAVGLVFRKQWGERGPHLYELLRVQ